MEHKMMGDTPLPEQDFRQRVLSDLASPDWRTRQQAVEAIVAINDQDLAEAVLELAKNHTASLELLSGAIKALEQVGRPLQEELIGLLHDSSSDLRVYIPILLGEMAAHEAVPALIALISNTSVNENERFYAVEALGKLRAREAGEALRQVLRSGSDYLRYASILALGEIGYAPAEPDLIAALADDYLSEPAVMALGVVGSAGSVVDIAHWLNRMASHGQCDQGAAVRSVVAIAQRSGSMEAVPASFTGALTEDGETCLMQMAEHIDPQASGDTFHSLAVVLGWLANTHGRTETDRALVRLLRHTDASPAAEAALLQAGEERQPAIISLLLEQTTAAEEASVIPAMRLLGMLKAEKAVPVLIDALNSENEDAAAQAAHALGQICRMEAVAPLLELLGHSAVQVRKAAVGALAVLNPPELAGQVSPLVERGDPHQRSAALSLLAMLDETLGAARALQAVSDENIEVRRLAVELLPRFRDPQVIPALEQALSDPDSSLRISAARACASLTPGAAEPLLLRAMQDENGWVRMQAVRSMTQHVRPETIEPLVEMLADPLAPVRIAAVDVLARLPLDQVEEHLRSALEDENEEVRESARRALGMAQE